MYEQDSADLLQEFDNDLRWSRDHVAVAYAAIRENSYGTVLAEFQEAAEAVGRAEANGEAFELVQGSLLSEGRRQRLGSARKNVSDLGEIIAGLLVE